jgi:hypothetical protein
MNGSGPLTVLNGAKQQIYVEIFDGDLKQAFSIGKLSLRDADFTLDQGQRNSLNVKRKYVTVTATPLGNPNYLLGALTVKRNSTAKVTLRVEDNQQHHCLSLKLIQGGA